MTGDPLTPLRKVGTYPDGATCVVEGCSAKVRGRGWCESHWRRWKTHGDPLAGRPSRTVARALDHDDGTRTCSVCQIRRPLDGFPLDRRGTLGRRSHCKTCHSTRAKVRYAADDNVREQYVSRRRDREHADPAAAQAYRREQYERHRDQRIAEASDHTHRRRARQVGASSDKGITVRALVARDGDACHYCSRTMDPSPGDRTYRPRRATIEHVLPLARGGHHVWSNVVLACWACNLSKNRLTVDEWQAAVAAGT